MAIETVRVVLAPDGVATDDASDRQILLDLTMDSETSACTGPFPAFGRVGDFRRPETLYPFALMFDGRMDFGAFAVDARRQGMLAIRAARLIPGERVDYRSGDDHDIYVVASVAASLG